MCAYREVIEWSKISLPSEPLVLWHHHRNRCPVPPPLHITKTQSWMSRILHTNRVCCSSCFRIGIGTLRRSKLSSWTVDGELAIRSYIPCPGTAHMSPYLMCWSEVLTPSRPPAMSLCKTVGRVGSGYKHFFPLQKTNKIKLMAPSC